MTANLVRWNWQGVSGFVLIPGRFFTEDRNACILRQQFLLLMLEV
jgi:hypothetical protein